MRRLIRIGLFIILALISSGASALSQQASASPTKPSSAPTPIPLAKVPLEAQSALASLQEIDANVSTDQSNGDVIAGTLSNLTSEIDPRIGEDTRLLRANPSLDMLYRTKLTWQNFGDKLSALARELTQRSMSLGEELAALNQLNKTWQATLQLAKEPDAPPTVLQSVQGVVDSIERTRQAVESCRAQILTLQSRLSEKETRVRTVLSSVEQSQILALKSLLVRDNPPIWSGDTGLGREWKRQRGESFSSQLKASTAFGKRLPFTFLIHALLIVVMATALHWTRRRIRKLAEEKTDLQRAVPILDLPVSTAIVLSFLISPSIYPQAPRLIHVIIGAVALIPSVVILRRLLERNSYPILNALVVMYFVDQLRVLAASLPELARLLFLGQMLGGSLFLLWLFRSRRLRTTAVETTGRFSQAMRAIAKIGLILMPAAFLANIFGYLNLGNLLGIIFLKSVYIAAVLYAAIRVLEGLITIALQVRPLGSLRVVNLHRPMLRRRTFHVLQFLAFLFWLHLMLSLFGLLTPLIATAEVALNANLVIGSFNISLGRTLALLIAVWGSFLVSRFLRFLLEADVYRHFQLERGIPYAISTMLHYVILLLGFFGAGLQRLKPVSRLNSNPRHHWARKSEVACLN
jgi:potassium efflux system protein